MHFGEAEPWSLACIELPSRARQLDCAVQQNLQSVPLGRYRHQRTARGRSDWLNLLCRTLSFPNPIRFTPALFGVPLFTPN